MNDQEACELLAGGNAVNGLEYLPIERIKSRITDEFSQDWQKLDQVTWEHNSAGLQLYTTSQMVCVYCSGLAGEDMNRIIDVLLEFGCPLYDPQVGQRFDSS